LAALNPFPQGALAWLKPKGLSCQNSKTKEKNEEVARKKEFKAKELKLFGRFK